jgi:hypothetical protein
MSLDGLQDISLAVLQVDRKVLRAREMTYTLDLLDIRTVPKWIDPLLFAERKWDRERNPAGLGLRCHREVLKRRQTLLGYFNEDTVSAEEVLAAILVQAGRLHEATRLEGAVYEFKRGKYGQASRPALSAM